MSPKASTVLQLQGALAWDTDGGTSSERSTRGTFWTGAPFPSKLLWGSYGDPEAPIRGYMGII